MGQCALSSGRHLVSFTVAFCACCFSAQEGQAVKDGASLQSERKQTQFVETWERQTGYHCHVVTSPIDVARVAVFTAVRCRCVPCADVQCG